MVVFKSTFFFFTNRNITFTVNIFAKLSDKHHACLYIPMTFLVHDLKKYIYFAV